MSRWGIFKSDSKASQNNGLTEFSRRRRFDTTRHRCLSKYTYTSRSVTGGEILKIRSNKVISRNVTEETVVRSALVFKLLKLYLYFSVFLSVLSKKLLISYRYCISNDRIQLINERARFRKFFSSIVASRALSLTRGEDRVCRVNF